MLTRLLIGAATPTAAHSVRSWIYHLGALGFIPLGLIDSSVIPVPGSMDVLTIVLAAQDRELWPYYAVMATLGSVLGGYITYRLARKGGEKALERRLPARRIKKIYRIFQRWGFAAIAIPALLPPPMPMVPFLLAAGAMNYSAKKFLAALALGRIARYMILAFLAARYGGKILQLLAKIGGPIAAVVVGAAVMALVVSFIVRGNRKNRHATKS